VRNAKLHDAMERYVVAAIRFLAGRCEPEVSLEQEWVERQAGDNVFDLVQDEMPRWTFCIHKHEEELHKLPEYIKLVGVMDEDETIRRQVGHQVVVGGHSYLLERRFITDSVVARTVTGSHEMSFNADRIRKRLCVH
jgi:hypothetical protein